MQANVDAKTGITRSFITLGYSDSTLKGVLPVDTVIKAMRKSKSNIVKKELARDIDGKIVDYEINVKTDNQAIGNIVLSAEYYIRVSECNGKTTLGSKVLVPEDPRDGWDAYKGKRAGGSIYITDFKGKKILWRNVIDVERLSDNERIALSKI